MASLARWSPSEAALVVTHTIAGLGGIGKTELAREFAHRCLCEGVRDLVWWFTASDRTSVVASMSRLHQQLQVVPSGNSDPELGAELLATWLLSTSLRWLVVLDNAEEDWVLDLLPECPQGRVLITSRLAEWPATVSVQRLDVLPVADAVSLLSLLSGRSATASGEGLVRELGCLALAIEQAGAYVRITGVEFDAYCDLVRANVSLHEHDVAGVGKSVAAAWWTSVDRVTRDSHSGPLVTHVLGVLAYLEADDIPRARSSTRRSGSGRSNCSMSAPRSTEPSQSLQASR